MKEEESFPGLGGSRYGDKGILDELYKKPPKKEEKKDKKKKEKNNNQKIIVVKNESKKNEPIIKYDNSSDEERAIQESLKEMELRKKMESEKF